MEDTTLATSEIKTSTQSTFKSTLEKRGAFLDDQPRIAVLAGGGLALTASQRNRQAPHDQMFYIGLDPAIRTGTHTIPGPMIKNLVYQERDEGIIEGDQWTLFNATSGTMKLELDPANKRFKATCTFTLKNKENVTLTGSAEMNVAYNSWPTAI
ncbi:hypothetical protein [Pseudomonas sp.]|uniref:hypothetical protein n=1 Tax=Pseudomonas sp. TaxID=306 RepID=UPI003F33F0B3